jgi:hypothetical protein
MLYFRGLQILITVGLILGIAGGTSSISPDGTYQPQTTSNVGAILYVLAFLALVLVALITVSKLTHAATNEKRLVWVVLLALPFILVRIVYSVISVFGKDRHFNLITGSVVIHVFMSVVEEMIVVIIYLFVGWRTEAVPASERGPIINRSWKGNMSGGGHQNGNEMNMGQNNNRRSRGHSGGRRMRQGPIHALVNAGIDAVQEHREGNTRRSER